MRILAILTTLALFATPELAMAQRVALVIGNAAYAHSTGLKNPPSDVRLLASSLREAGYETVEMAENLSLAQMMASLQAFQRKAQGAEAALVYYSGHGIEGKGSNWLLPVDADLKSEADLPFEAIELNRVMESVEGAGLRMVVLDACRNNPFASQWKSANRAVSQGLAPVEADNVLVIYAAAPGAVAYDGGGTNSPFAKALARRIEQPGLPVQLLGGLVRDDVLSATGGKQRPFISASITGTPITVTGQASPGGLALLAPEGNGFGGQRGDGGEASHDAPASLLPSPASDDVPRTGSDDALAWKAALKVDTVPGYRSYLAEHPRGAYATFAQANIDQLLDPTANGGEVSGTGILGVKSLLPDRYALAAGPAQPIDGVWLISTIKKRVRIEGGRAFAVDGWRSALVFAVLPDQVTLKNLQHSGPGTYSGYDMAWMAKSDFKVRKDGNIDVLVHTFPFKTKYRLVKVGLDNPQAFAADLEATKD